MSKASVLLEAFDALPTGSIIVEIGCVRFAKEVPSDGYSTVYLATAAKERGWRFYSVDRDPQAVATARAAVGDLPASIAQADGAEWLAAFAGQIDGLYLDGSADPAETLAQYRVANLASSAVLAVDDIQPIGEAERGKGDLVLDALEADGFAVEILPTLGAYKMAVANR